MDYDKIIYVAGKFQNKPQNKRYIENCCKDFQKLFPHYLFLNGVSQFSYLYDVVTQQEALDMCIQLMLFCDEIWTVGNYEDSVGTYSEIMSGKVAKKGVFLHMDKEIHIPTYRENEIRKERW